MSGTWQRLQDWLTVVIGVLLFVAPFVLGATANQAAAWTAYAGGVLLAIAGLWSLSSPAEISLLIGHKRDQFLRTRTRPTPHAGVAGASRARRRARGAVPAGGSANSDRASPRAQGEVRRPARLHVSTSLTG